MLAPRLAFFMIVSVLAQFGLAILAWVAFPRSFPTLHWLLLRFRLWCYAS